MWELFKNIGSMFQTYGPPLMNIAGEGMDIYKSLAPLLMGEDKSPYPRFDQPMVPQVPQGRGREELAHLAGSARTALQGRGVYSGGAAWAPESLSSVYAADPNLQMEMMQFLQSQPESFYGGQYGYWGS